jgi:gas vesicle protein
MIMSKKKAIVSVLTGVAIGAAIGILFAPDNGAVTRRRFKRKTFAYDDELEKKFNDLIESITQQFENVVREVNQMAEERKVNTIKI